MESDRILEFSKTFAANGECEKYAAPKRPRRRLAVVSCMDTRLTEMLSAAMGLHDGDAVMIKNAGGLVRDMHGGEVRSLLVAVYELGVREIMVVGHTDCGVEGLSAAEMKKLMLSRGIDAAAVSAADDAWLGGFAEVRGAVRESVSLLRAHPLIPDDVAVRGFVMDVKTGGLEEV
jgi:carbonic anhydrase